MNHSNLFARIISAAVAYIKYQEYGSQYFILEFHKKENALVTPGRHVWISFFECSNTLHVVGFCSSKQTI